MLNTIIFLLVVLVICILLYVLLFSKKTCMPIIIISLKRSQDRMERLKNILSNIDYDIFNAIDGKNDDITELKNKYVIENTLNPGQTGCLLSHITLWKKLLESKNDKLVILEDDITVTSIFHKFVNANTELPENFDIIFLGHCFEIQGEKTNIMFNEREHVELHKSICPRCTHGYIVSKSGAKKLLDYFENNKVDLPIDEMLCRLMSTLKSYSMYPIIVKQSWQDENTQFIPSTIT